MRAKILKISQILTAHMHALFLQARSHMTIILLNYKRLEVSLRVLHIISTAKLAAHVI